MSKNTTAVTGGGKCVAGTPGCHQSHITNMGCYPTGEGKVPRVGQLYRVYGQQCRIAKVRPFGTIDVETLDSERAYRVTGLPFI